MTSAFTCLFFLTAAALGQAAEALIPAKIEFNRDIRPVLSDNCFYCHGPDKNHRKAKLRLDIREEALAKEAFVPGKPQESELVKRLSPEDKDDLMPPADSHKKLTEREKALLKRWVEQGAGYQLHWSYEKPVKASIPAGQNAVDVLVRKRLEEIGLKPAPQADRRTLIRRLYSDLLGLPPKPEEVTAFENDPSPKAYETLVDRVLARPQYGERMAVGWLDVVRYADTIGYHSDTPRNVFPYRDYVIKAYNDNKRFDRFTLEQLAGDLLPDADQETRVASAFNRLLLSTEEGGAQAKDYEARMLTDRVRAVGAAWMGQTTGCCQCHDHKFDPLSQHDFYSLGAFFADVKEAIIGRREEGMPVPSAAEQKKLDDMEGRLKSLKAEFDRPYPELAADQQAWEKSAAEAAMSESSWQLMKPLTVAGAKKNVLLKADKEGVVHATLDEKREARKQNDGTEEYTVTVKAPQKGVTGFRIEALREKDPGVGLSANGNFVLSEVTVTSGGKPVKLAQASATFQQNGFTAATAVDGITKDKNNGWGVLGGTGTDQALYLELAEPLGDAGAALTFKLTFGWGENHEIRNLRLSATTAPKPVVAPGTGRPAKEIADILTKEAVKRTPEEKNKVAASFKQATPKLNDLRTRLATVEKQKADFEKTVPKCLITVSVADKRTVRILSRGNFMDETGEVVKAALPHYLPQPKIEDREPTRLDLAKWLVSSENPLTARTVMNRMWAQFFGIGLSKVLSDLGAQGEAPANIPLLDWLACEFMDSGWDVKHMVRAVVMSQTYRQASFIANPEAGQEDIANFKLAIERDPYNRELARQSSLRIDDELVRDNALSIAGLLVPKIGGPSVKHYQ
ncbi:MAG: Planctomycete cytochrome, partial [Verrucomicrobiaceae bacterium]|nr:Planctomycete cytochrome [Verrucomicrobiaceae bacterium]